MADERDVLAASRDLKADLDDQAAVERDGGDGQLDTCPSSVPESRLSLLSGAKQASLARTRAKHDRELAKLDRELGAQDREESRRDREYAGTDELTGARRRGAGLEDLHREIDRARRTGQTLTAAYIDVNGLKEVNDRHGHRAGDELLQDIVADLQHGMRPYDLLVRVGGDEFLCIMPGISADQARLRFERIGPGEHRRARAGLVSIGVSELRDGEGTTGLINRADQDLLKRRRRLV